MTDLPPSNVLPLIASRILQEAAKTPIPAHDPLARVKAIEKATQRIKAAYPHHFRKD